MKPKAPIANKDTAPIPGAAGSMADTGTAGAASPVSGEAARPAASDTSAGSIAAAQGGATPSRPEEAARAAEAQVLAGRPQDSASAAEAVAGSASHAPGVGSGPVGDQMVDHIHQTFADPTNAPAITELRRQLGAVEGGVAVEVPAGGGISPGVMSSEGSFGGAEARHLRRDVGSVVDPESLRHDLAGQRDIVRDLAMVAYTGAKLAAAMPKTREGIEALRAEGFDLVVTSRQEGFRRAGVGHPAAPTLRRSQDFSAAEIEALEAERMLIVQALR